MGRGRKTKPLFYIEQPYIDANNPSMQKTYHLKVQEREEIKEKKVDFQRGKEDIIVEKEDFTVNIEESSAKEIVAIEPNELALSQSEDEEKRKPFSALSVQEKIEYLEEFPVTVIKILYSFITTEGKTIGYFVSIGDETINILPKNKRKPIGIAVSEIIDIKVYGL